MRFSDKPAELAALRQRYRGRTDPWYNPNTSLDNERFEIHPYRRPPPGGGPVRLIAVTHNLNHEGAPNSQLEIILGLKKREIIDPVILSPSDGPLRSLYEAANVPVELVSHEIGGTGRFEHAQQTLCRIFRQSGAEVVYANTLQTFWAITAARKAHIPAVWNVRESEAWQSYFDYLPSDVRSCAYEAFHYPYRIVFVAHATNRAWSPLNSHHNFTTVHNGLDLRKIEKLAIGRNRSRDREELGIGSDELAIVLLGTVCERKGQLDLVRAATLLPPELWPRLRFFIVGDRPSDYSGQLTAEAGSLPSVLRRRISIVPETGEPFRYFSAADVAVCCSRVESYPRVTLEAMAFGLPLVTTPVFGISEQVRNEISALFYDPGNAAELARQLQRLITDDDLRKSMSSNASSTLVCLPGFEEMLDRYGSIFKEAHLSRGDPCGHPGMHILPDWKQARCAD